MKINKSTTRSETIEFNEKDIREILKKYVIDNWGEKWDFSIYHLSEQRTPTMGQLDDEYETVAIFKLEEVEEN